MRYKLRFYEVRGGAPPPISRPPMRLHACPPACQ